MSILLGLQDLTVKAVADGWVADTKTVPAGARDVHDYWTFSNAISPSDEITYDFANDVLVYPQADYDQAQRREVMNVAEQLKNMYDRFINPDNVVTEKTGFEISNS